MEENSAGRHKKVDRNIQFWRTGGGSQHVTDVRHLEEEEFNTNLLIFLRAYVPSLGCLSIAAAQDFSSHYNSPTTSYK